MSNYTKPQLMRQIADAMERNPEGWWEEFEFWGTASQSWISCQSVAQALGQAGCTQVRPKPRTYTLHIEGMPEPLREEPKFNEVHYVLWLGNASPLKAVWEGSDGDFARLKRGLCYPDEATACEALEKLSKAMGGEK